jgi:hypothetical protein
MSPYEVISLIQVNAELLKALKLADHALDPDSGPLALTNREICKILRAAIEKAELT